MSRTYVFKYLNGAAYNSDYVIYTQSVKEASFTIIQLRCLDFVCSQFLLQSGFEVWKGDGRGRTFFELQERLTTLTKRLINSSKTLINFA